MKKIIIFIILTSLISISGYTQNNAKYQVLTGFETDIYKEPYHRNFNIYHAGLGYKSELTAVYGKMNFGYLNKNINGVVDETTNQKQFEFELYQSFDKSKKTSIWANAAFSQDDLFPDVRVSFELWQKIYKGYLISGGFNHYVSTDNVTITNIGAEKYFSRYWLEFKTYFFHKTPDVKTSYFLSGRMFFKDVNFLHVGVGYGSAQDEPFYLVSDLDAMTSYTGRIGYTTNTLFNNKMRLSGNFVYNYEEYLYGLEKLWRNRYSFGVSLVYNIN